MQLHLLFWKPKKMEEVAISIVEIGGLPDTFETSPIYEVPNTRIFAVSFSNILYSLKITVDRNHVQCGDRITQWVAHWLSTRKVQVRISVQPVTRCRPSAHPAVKWVPGFCWGVKAAGSGLASGHPPHMPCRPLKVWL